MAVSYNNAVADTRAAGNYGFGVVLLLANSIQLTAGVLMLFYQACATKAVAVAHLQQATEDADEEMAWQEDTADEAPRSRASVVPVRPTEARGAVRGTRSRANTHGLRHA